MLAWCEEEVTTTVSVYTSLQFCAILFKVVNACILSDEEIEVLHSNYVQAVGKRHNFQNADLQLTSSVR